MKSNGCINVLTMYNFIMFQTIKTEYVIQQKYKKELNAMDATKHIIQYGIEWFIDSSFQNEVQVY